MITTIDVEFISPSTYTDIIEWFDDNDIQQAFINEQVEEGVSTGLTRRNFAAPGYVTSSANNYGMDTGSGKPPNSYTWYKDTSGGATDGEIRFVVNGVRSDSNSSNISDTVWSSLTL